MDKPNTKTSKAKLAKLVLPILIMIVGAMVFRSLLESKPVISPPLLKEKVWSVQTQPLIEMSLAPEVEIQGKVEAPDRYYAAAPGVGWVQTVNVREGDNVVAGDVLLSLDPRDFVTGLTQAKAELVDIQAQLVEAEIKFTQNKTALSEEQSILKLAQKSVARSMRLIKQSLSSESALDEAKKALMSQQLSVNQRELEVNSFSARKQQLQAREQRAQAQFEQAERALERSRVIAPYAGVIDNVSVAVGARVNAGADLVSMYSPAQLEIRALLPARYQDEIDLALKQGQVLLARDMNSLNTFELLRLSGKAQPGGIDSFFKEHQSLKTGLYSDSLISLLLKRPVQKGLYRVPAISIYDNTRIYLLRDGRLHGITIDNIGQSEHEGVSYRLVRSEAIEATDKLVLTRLPNATTGLKVKAIDVLDDD